MNTRERCTIYRVQQTATYTIYTKDGLKHRVDGPAVIAGDEEWYYLNGTLKTPDEHKHFKSFSDGLNGLSSKEEMYYTQALCRPTGIYTTSE